MPSYNPTSAVLAAPHDAPEQLDCIVIQYQSTTLYIHGILHGITGAPNRKYKQFVQRSINQAPGVILAEKSLHLKYQGIHASLEDWAAMPCADACQLGLRLLASPRALWAMLHGAITEPFTRIDKFGECGFGRLQDISGSPAFHAISPNERRQIAGFPAPEAYLRINLQRRQNRLRRHFPPPVFPAADWAWLTAIEPATNIPLRSLHMIEFAAEYTKAQGTTIASLYVGEIHNSDMAWLAQHLTNDEHSRSWSDKDKLIITQTRSNARAIARSAAAGDRMIIPRIIYFAALGLGFAPAAIAAIITLAWIFPNL